MTSHSTNDPLRLYREALGKQLLQQVMVITSEAMRDGHVFEAALEQLGRELADSIIRLGLVASDDGGKIVIGSEDHASLTTQIGVRLHAAWSDRPIDLIVFCVQAMESARSDTRLAKTREGETLARHRRLLDSLAAAENMDDVRAAVRADEYA